VTVRPLDRLRAPDSYGLLLLLVLASIFASAFANDALSRAIVVAFLLAVLVFALWTSRAPRRLAVVFAACVIVTLVVVAVAPAIGGTVEWTVEAAAGAVLSIAAIAAIVRRLAAHPLVDAATILGAVDVYLLLGLFFAGVYSLIAAVDAGPLFAQALGDGRALDRIYFSFVTLTTVGFGDVTARSDAARVVAVSEALLGQIYLVTVVALLVGNIGGRRRRPERER
jgi:hypothetical protein